MRNVVKNPWTVWWVAMKYGRNAFALSNAAPRRYLVDHTQRCLDLWKTDPSLIIALEVANRMQPALRAIVSMLRSR
jgi:hypothetical protein